MNTNPGSTKVATTTYVLWTSANQEDVALKLHKHLKRAEDAIVVGTCIMTPKVIGPHLEEFIQNGSDDPLRELGLDSAEANALSEKLLNR